MSTASYCVSNTDSLFTDTSLKRSQGAWLLQGEGVGIEQTDHLENGISEFITAGVTSLSEIHLKRESELTLVTIQRACSAAEQGFQSPHRQVQASLQVASV